MHLCSLVDTRPSQNHACPRTLVLAVLIGHAFCSVQRDLSIKRRQIASSSSETSVVGGRAVIGSCETYQIMGNGLVVSPFENNGLIQLIVLIACKRNDC